MKDFGLGDRVGISFSREKTKQTEKIIRRRNYNDTIRHKIILPAASPDAYVIGVLFFCFPRQAAF